MHSCKPNLQFCLGCPTSWALVQEAAGAFAHLRDVAALRVEQPRPVDISPECASMLERLCLAQAQECIFEKARADNKSSAILARYVYHFMQSDPQVIT